MCIRDSYKGTLKGRATIVPDGNGVDVRGTLALKDIDTAAFLWDAYARTWVSGALTTNIDVYKRQGDGFDPPQGARSPLPTFKQQKTQNQQQRAQLGPGALSRKGKQG